MRDTERLGLGLDLNCRISTISELATLNQQRATATYNGPVQAFVNNNYSSPVTGTYQNVWSFGNRNGVATVKLDGSTYGGGTMPNVSLTGNGPFFSSNGAIQSTGGPAGRNMKSRDSRIDAKRRAGQAAGRRHQRHRAQQLQHHRSIRRDEVTSRRPRRVPSLSPERTWTIATSTKVTWQKCNYWCQSPIRHRLPTNRHFLPRIFGRAFQGEYDQGLRGQGLPNVFVTCSVGTGV